MNTEAAAKGWTTYPFKLAFVSQVCNGPDGFGATGLEQVSMMDASLQKLCSLAPSDVEISIQHFIPGEEFSHYGNCSQLCSMLGTWIQTQTIVIIT